MCAPNSATGGADAKIRDGKNRNLSRNRRGRKTTDRDRHSKPSAAEYDATATRARRRKHAGQVSTSVQERAVRQMPLRTGAVGPPDPAADRPAADAAPRPALRIPSVFPRRQR